MFGFGSKRKLIIGLFKGYNMKANRNYVYEFQKNGDLILSSDGLVERYKWDLVNKHLHIFENNKLLQDSPIKIDKAKLIFLWSTMGEEDFSLDRIPQNMEEIYRYKNEYVAPALNEVKKVSVDEMTNEHKSIISNYLIMDQKIMAIKYLRDVTGMQLAEAKNTIDNWE